MKIRFRVLFIIWIIVILVVSSIPDLRIIPRWHLTLKDKIAHFTEYAILASLFMLMLRQENRILSYKRRLLTVLCFGLLLSVIDELHQLFIPGRSTDILDIVADFLGIVIITFVFNLARNRIETGNLKLKISRKIQ